MCVCMCEGTMSKEHIESLCLPLARDLLEMGGGGSKRELKTKK